MILLFGLMRLFNANILFCFFACSHLERNNLLIALPFEEWYGSCFAGVIAKSSLIRIWDKICGGSRKIVVFVFIVLFNTLWRTTKLPNTFDWIEVAKIISYVSMQCMPCAMP